MVALAPGAVHSVPSPLDTPVGPTNRLTEAAALTLLSISTVAGLYKGLPNRGVVAIAAVAWLASAARTLADVRLGRRRPLQPTPETRGVFAAAVVLGVGPWLLMGPLRQLYPSWTFWSPLALPTWLVSAGVVLALVSVVLPAFRSRDWNPAGRPLIPRVSPASVVLMLALFMTSGSLVIALVAAVWLAAGRSARAAELAFVATTKT